MPTSQIYVNVVCHMSNGFTPPPPLLHSASALLLATLASSERDGVCEKQSKVSDKECS